MPLAALGGSREIMEHLSPLGPVYQAGTLSGNPLATAAGLKTLELADHAVYARTAAVADVISRAIEQEAEQAEVALKVNRAGSLFSDFLGNNPQNTEYTISNRLTRKRLSVTALSSTLWKNKISRYRLLVLKPGLFRPLTMIGQLDGFYRRYRLLWKPPAMLKMMTVRLRLFYGQFLIETPLSQGEIK